MECDDDLKGKILGVLIARKHSDDLRELVDFEKLEDGQLAEIIQAGHNRYNENKAFNIRVNAIVQDIINAILDHEVSKVTLQ